MVIDDHDVHDDWNISAAWVEEMRKLDWWAERECAGHRRLLALSVHRQPLAELLRESELLAEVREADDGWEVLREFAANERGERDGARWSYCRDLGVDPPDRASTRESAGCSTRTAARCSTTTSGSGSRRT